MWTNYINRITVVLVRDESYQEARAADHRLAHCARRVPHEEAGNMTKQFWQSKVEKWLKKNEFRTWKTRRRMALQCSEDLGCGITRAFFWINRFAAKDGPYQILERGVILDRRVGGEKVGS